MQNYELDKEQRALLLGGAQRVRQEKSAEKISRIVAMGGEIG